MDVIARPVGIEESLMQAPSVPLTHETKTRDVYWEHLWDLVVILTQKEIKARYKNSALGYVWSVANPLLFAVIYYIVFGQIMKVPIENYSLFLMAALLPWHWLANSVIAAPNVFLANATLIKKVRFPRNVLVVSYVLNEGIHFVLSIPVIAGFLLVNHMTPTDDLADRHSGSARSTIPDRVWHCDHVGVSKPLFQRFGATDSTFCNGVVLFNSDYLFECDGARLISHTPVCQPGCSVDRELA